MKTVVHAYKQNIKRENCPDTYNTYWGIGDCIRGSLTLFRLSKILNFNLVIDIRHHPISNFLIKKYHIYENIVDENINELKFFQYLNNLQNYIENSFINNDIVCVHTNAFINENEIYFMYIDPLNNEEKEFIKNIFNYNEQCIFNFNLKLNNLNENFEILHFRIGDNYFLNNINLVNDDLIKFENVFKENYREGDLLISDNQFFKSYIKSKYNITIFDVAISHLGIDSDLSMVENTLFDFYIQSKCKKIKAYTVYEWISGFVQWNAKVYDIPLEKII